uniref:Methyltransferase domain-containing protein n=1 Tax=Tetraselmis chuii TaxID=63592 RepID=A0A7S1SIH7_9CHLO
MASERRGRSVDTIWDLACGHGLLGIMLACRFPRKRVVCVDLEARPAFAAYRAAWERCGDLSPGWEKPLQNVEYREGDLLGVFESGEVKPGDCCVALHACNEANRDVVEGARHAGASWAVMPCCIRTALYLPDCGLEQLPSDSRYMLLAGAFGGQYDAQIVRSIDRRITARPILLAGGLPLGPTADCNDSANGGRALRLESDALEVDRNSRAPPLVHFP